MVKNKIYIAILSLFLFFGEMTSYAQIFSYKGTEFIFPNHSSQRFYIVTDNIQANITITDLNSSSFSNYTIPADTSYLLTSVGSFAPTRLNYLSSTIQNASTRIVSSSPVSLYCELGFSDVAPIIPTDFCSNKQTLLTHYKEFDGQDIAPPSYIVTAMQDSTVVKIKPTHDCSNGWLAGSTYFVNLNMGESFPLTGKLCYISPPSCAVPGSNYNFTGTTFETLDSCQKINIEERILGTIYGGLSTTIGATFDHSFEMYMPDKYAGNNHYVVPELHVKNGNLFKAMALSNSTRLFINGTFVKTLQANQFFDTLLKQPSHISANKDFLLNQYYLSSLINSIDTTNADIFNVYPYKYQSKYLKVYHNRPPSPLSQKHLSIVTETANCNTFTLNGVPLACSIFAPFSSDPSKSFAYLRVSGDYHNLKSSASFQGRLSHNLRPTVSPFVQGASYVFVSLFDTTTYEPPDVVMLDTCLFDTIPLEARLDAPAWQWSTGATTQTININSGGIYWVHNIYCSDTITDTFDIQGYIYEFRKEYICSNDSFSFGNTYFNTPGNYIDTFLNPLSCDTIVYLNLKYYNPPPVSLLVLDTICKGGVFTFNAKNYSQSGIYYDTLKYPSGCDSLYYELDLLVYADTTVFYDTICEDDFYPIYSDSFNIANTYSYIFPNQFGCDSVVQFNLSISPVFHFYEDSTFCISDSIEILQKIINQDGVNRFFFKTAFGCDSIIDYNILNHCPDLVFVPNSFTPNNDDLNDIFLPKFLNEDEVSKYKLSVFNRWGELIFQSEDYTEGWDGFFNGELSKQDIYIWQVSYSVQFERKVVFGHVNLLR